jgi:C-terminal processing protease CtpA/Prc
LAFSILLTTLSGCTGKKHLNTQRVGDWNSLRPLNQAERETDFATMISAFRELYGPLEYKEKRFGFKLDDLAKQYGAMAAQAKSDDEYAGIISQFLSRFHDGHISLEISIQKNDRYVVPLLLTPVENKVLVGALLDDKVGPDYGISIGDEVLEVDGKAPLSYMETILKYESFATDLSNRHWVARILRRPTYLTELIPTQPTVQIKFRRASGEIYTQSLVWTLTKGKNYVDRRSTLHDAFKQDYSFGLNEVIKLTANEIGQETPFFLTTEVVATYGLVQVQPSDEYLQKFGLKDLTKKPNLYAAMYRHEGKSILLIRIGTYDVEDPAERIAWYKAVLAQYGGLVDALVIDQTHNPGGALDYAAEFVSIFANQDTRGPVNFLHADRRWLANIGTAVNELSAEKITGAFLDFYHLAYDLVETAYDKGLNLTEKPIPLTGTSYIAPAADFHFDKPVLMLIDELAGSCGDVVPMLMKSNSLAVLFGQTTMGLGGNVEPAVNLLGSQMTVHLTRGFFATFEPSGNYDLENPVENNGIAPDISYSHTVDDFRAGYIEYVKAFSDAVAGLSQ